MHSRRNLVILFSTRILRLFAYGFFSVILVLYLVELGFKAQTIGLFLTLALVGDVVISLWITTNADRIGRRRMLVFGALLLLFTGLLLFLTRHFLAIILVMIFGVISPSGNEIGPFLAIEQAGLAQTIDDKKRTKTFAWYHLAGALATALGALIGGTLLQVFLKNAMSELVSYRICLMIYASIGLLLCVLFLNLSPTVEVAKANHTPSKKIFLGLHQSKKRVFKLSGLFALDAFGGGLIVQSLIIYWFRVRFGADPITLGSIFFGTNLLAGLSALLAAKIADRIGLIKTMVFTHIPSNILLMLVPVMPNLLSAVIMLLVRFSISQMDVPTRQSYMLAVVRPDERSAASGFANTARSVGAALAPSLSGYLIALPALMNSIFFFAGGLKIIYDLILYRSFVHIRPPEE